MDRETPGKSVFVASWVVLLAIFLLLGSSVLAGGPKVNPGPLATMDTGETITLEYADGVPGGGMAWASRSAGTITVDESLSRHVSPRFLLHELGHIAGFDHSDGGIMSPNIVNESGAGHVGPVAESVAAEYQDVHTRSVAGAGWLRFNRPA